MTPQTVALQSRNSNSRLYPLTHCRMPTAELPARYVTALSLPRHLAEHVADQAAARGLTSAGYIRLLVARDAGLDAVAPVRKRSRA